MKPIDRLAYFIKEREKIRIAKEAGKPKPWTKDKILQTYRFTNIHRENDKVTKWVAKNWRRDYSEPESWFAMAVARFINWPPTLEAIDFPVPWKPEKVKKILHSRMDKGVQVFTGVYIIPSNGPKIDYIVDKVLTPMWKARKRMYPYTDITLEEFYTKLGTFNGVGSFMAGQIIADCKEMEPFAEASDWDTFAVSGPGSKRGLNIVCGRKWKTRWTGNSWKEELDKLRSEIAPKIAPIKLHAQDLQNCLCELSKYERTRLSKGRPRSLYPGKEN